MTEKNKNDLIDYLKKLYSENSSLIPAEVREIINKLELDSTIQSVEKIC